MKRYIKKVLTPEILDGIRINLSGVSVKMGAEPVCDFCGDTAPTTVYAAHRMSTGVERQCWRWCACSVCDELLTENKFDLVLDRLMERLRAMTQYRFSVEVVRYAAEEAFRTFLNDVVEEG